MVWTWITSSYTVLIGYMSSIITMWINKCKIDLPKEPKITQESRIKFNNNKLVKVAALLERSTQYNNLTKELLLKAIDNSKNTGEILLITKMKTVVLAYF